MSNPPKTRRRIQIHVETTSSTVIIFSFRDSPGGKWLDTFEVLGYFFGRIKNLPRKWPKNSQAAGDVFFGGLLTEGKGTNVIVFLAKVWKLQKSSP